MQTKHGYNGFLGILNMHTCVSKPQPLLPILHNPHHTRSKFEEGVFPPSDGLYTCTAKKTGQFCESSAGIFWELTKTSAQVHPLHRSAMAPKAELKRWCPIREDTEDYLKKIFEEVRTFGAACGSLALFRGRSAAISTSKGRHEAH